VEFYVGLHQPSDAKHCPRAFMSVNRLRGRKADLGCPSWIMDSGAFTEISTHGHYREGVEAYAEHVNRWAGRGLVAAVAQDYMCEPFIVTKTGLSVKEHQRLTIERYDDLIARSSAPIMPVLQGYRPEEYVEHLAMYGGRLPQGAYVGVGSVCKRNGDIRAVEAILVAIKRVRPDLRLHGFGLKATALSSAIVQDVLHSADSMAWSFAARREGRGRNDWREAKAWAERIACQRVWPAQYELGL
jgi:hypothetical protein